MNFLKIRVIVDGKTIYPLQNDKPVVIPLDHNYSKIVATDGFHITKPVELVYTHRKTYHLKIVCAIDNDLLAAGLVLLVIFSLVGSISHILLLKVLSFAPIIYFLFFYYINRKDFIRIRPA